MTIEYNTTLFQTIFIFQIEIRQEKMNWHVFPKSRIVQIRLFKPFLMISSLISLLINIQDELPL